MAEKAASSEGGRGPEAQVADSPSSDVHGLPTTVRAASETSFDEWGSGLPVPPPAETEEGSAWGAAGSVMPPSAGAPETVDDPRIPAGQSSFKIGEVAKIVGVKPYVLRYWESELAIIAPEKTDTRQRRYRREDVAMLLQVRRLRHDEKLSVARIRVLLKRSDAPAHSAPLQDPMHQEEANAPERAVSMAPVERGALLREIEHLRRAVLELLETVED